MTRSKFSIVIYMIIALAIIGLISQLLTNTLNFLYSIFVMLGIGLAIFAAIYFLFLRGRAPSNDMKKYKKAVKQSKVKYNQSGKTSSVASAPTSRNKSQPLSARKKDRKRPNHLRVIDGNKSKRKKRASN